MDPKHQIVKTVRERFIFIPDTNTCGGNKGGIVETQYGDYRVTKVDTLLVLPMWRDVGISCHSHL